MFDRFRFRLQHDLKRWRRAWHYATDTMTREDAQWIAYDADNVAGCWALECIAVDGLLESAREIWPTANNADLETLAYRAARRVADKWEGSGDVVANAEEWAITLISEYAEQDGVDLGGKQ